MPPAIHRREELSQRFREWLDEAQTDPRPTRNIFVSRQHLLHHITMHVGQAVIAPGMTEGQLFVIQSELMQDRGVEIVDVYAVFGYSNPMFVGRAVDDAAFHPTSGQPR